jgi:hypothetical protein
VLALLLLVQPTQGAVLVCVASHLALAAQELDHAGAANEASPDGCCAGKQESGSDGGSHENCPCPFPCASGCAGQPRGLLPFIALPERIQLPVLAAFTPRQERTPPNPERPGILHVPKRSAEALS